MARRHPPPRLLLMTDERLGAALWPALAALPRGAGVVVRHHGLPRPERRALWERVRAVARRRGLAALLAGSPAQAVGWRADGAHGPSPHRRAARPLIRVRTAHDAVELVAAGRTGADLVLVSPVFPTRSHPGARPLGPLRFGRLARTARGPAVLALGGVDRGDLRRLRALGAAGWAAIDGLVPGVRTCRRQNLKVVPT